MNNNEQKQKIFGDEQELGRALMMANEKSIGVLDAQFLGKSISVLNPRTPISVSETETMENVLKRLCGHNISSVVVVNEKGKLAGIFTERDGIRKGLSAEKKDLKRPVKDFMTKDPICHTPDISMAFALNLMSQGGFRHIPLVDEENYPVGVISVRDVMDYIVSTFVNDLMNFPTIEV